jgi:CO/xanthine dehydrogenase FAD-binding subunit
MEQLRVHAGKGRIIAGGTDLMAQFDRAMTSTQPVDEPDIPILVDVSGLSLLEGIALEGNVLSIGAAVTMAELAESELVREHSPALAEAAATAASPQIRNVATVGGNLANASPAADTATPLAALGGHIQTLRQEGGRTISVRELFLGPGRTCLEPDEIITRVLVHPRSPGEGQAFLKMGKRRALSISLVNVAARLVVEGGVVAGADLALGAVAPTILVLSEPLGHMVIGRMVDDGLLKEVAAMVSRAVSPISDLRATAEYRRAMAGVLARRAVEAAYMRSTGAAGEALKD